VREPGPDAGQQALATLEDFLKQTGFNAAGAGVLGGFVEAWMWRFCPV
jgi:hypothetical protein